MKCLIVFCCLAAVMIGGCGSDSPTSNPPEAFGVDTLSTGLEYPTGLWVSGSKVYFTETAARNTGYGGALTLRSYNLSTGVESLLVNNPTNSDAVVVAGDGKIYLASYVGSVPGQSGAVSVVNPATLAETPVVALEIAVKDMFIEGNNDISLIGSSDLGGAKSLYRLPAGAYTSPEVLSTGLGRVWCLTKLNTDIYYSNLTAIVRIPGGGTAETFLTKSVQSLSAATDRLFYADFFGGKIGMINLSTKADSTLLSGLHYPYRVRWVPSTRRLYFVECGTNAAEYKDGTLQVVKGIQ